MIKQTRITLKSVSVMQRLSEETYCFNANLYLDGKKVGEVWNHGQGGSHCYGPFGLEDKLERIVKEMNLPAVQAHGMELTVDLELLVSDLVGQALERKQLLKDMRTHIVFRTSSGELMKVQKVRQGEQQTRLYQERGDTVLNALPIEQAVEIVLTGAAS